MNPITQSQWVNSETEFDHLVSHLGVEHRSKKALRRLMAAGSAATPSLRRGLRHPDPSVRVGCCKVLDHFLDEDALPELIDNLNHEDETVRGGHRRSGGPDTFPTSSPYRPRSGGFASEAGSLSTKKWFS